MRDVASPSVHTRADSKIMKAESTVIMGKIVENLRLAQDERVPTIRQIWVLE